MAHDKKNLWRKAAVLGSFLHNAHIPFSGEFLTAIGIAILVSGHRLWPERGLLWRTGLVCAAMKSVSPSAVILGPMFAISAEGLLAEAGVGLLGGNAAGNFFSRFYSYISALGPWLLWPEWPPGSLPFLPTTKQPPTLFLWMK